MRYVDDLVVIDYGRKWHEFTDLSFRVGLRHSEHDEQAKAKRTIMLYEADDMGSFTTQEKLDVLKSASLSISLSLSISISLSLSLSPSPSPSPFSSRQVHFLPDPVRAGQDQAHGALQRRRGCVQ